MHNHKHAIVFTQSPFATDKGKEGLELALTLATYEQPIALFFTGQAPLQLAKNINSDLLQRKNYTQGFNALDLYDIEQVYINAQSLDELQLNQRDLSIAAQVLSTEEFVAKLSHFDVVLQF
ncbi:DsrE family protein [Catenovulum agarivorans DS-2]|uniref:DsrE family protein n=1 Tax=Catenovulum agarivorans DS-2 TaxID=1328313 RepID=W7QEP0_9ALTE|nr:sulfurtransferase complex subunit TusC [Catenovulum agarivorans]EWH10386.1 DsrE family protein [Catenovulum agarivorans DS-2]